jgi:protein-S-isoprenylcysteine O-methyltransferase Ste14
MCQKIMVRKHIVLTLLVGAGFASLVTRLSPRPWDAMQIAGLSLSAVGFVFWTIARFQLGSSFSVTAQARQLVTRGLYSRIRNPIYVFGSCFIGGAILAVRRPVWLLIFAIIIPMQLWRARKEEQVLEAKFGEQYRSYRAGTWF